MHQRAILDIVKVSKISLSVDLFVVKLVTAELEDRALLSLCRRF